MKIDRLLYDCFDVKIDRLLCCGFGFDIKIDWVLFDCFDMKIDSLLCDGFGFDVALI